MVQTKTKIEPFLKVGAKENIKDKILKLIKLPHKPTMNRISKKEVIIKAIKGRGKRQQEITIHTYVNEVNVVTEISRKKDNTKVIKVKTEIQTRFLFKI